MKYKCICGREFESIQSFRGHKSQCVQHLISKGYDEKTLYSMKNKRLSGFIQSNNLEHINAELQRKEKLNAWCAETHVCETCGKLMTEKFGSGRFCSRACANTRTHSESTKLKISISVSKSSKTNKIIRPKKPICIESICTICGNTFIRKSRKPRATCSEECLHKLRVLKSANAMQRLGYRKTVYSQFKFGTYKGIECDSSWELAFLVYCLDHNIPIKRNVDGFAYVYDNLERTFFPDFLVENTYYEIKGVWSAQVVSKVEQFPKDKNLVVIDRKKMKKYIKYCSDTYGESFAELLYDTDKPNWTQSEKYKHYINRKYNSKSISNIHY